MREMLAASALLGLHSLVATGDPVSDPFNDGGSSDPVRKVLFAEPRLATFTSERPLTKRQRRRQRGRKGADHDRD